MLFFNQKQTTTFVLKPIINMMLFLLRVLTKIDYTVLGWEILKENVKNGPVILGCEHQSIWETFVIFSFFDKISTVVKKELFSIPIAGLYFKKLGCIPINRSAAIRSLRNIVKFSKESVKHNTSILIFPSGTRSSGSDYKFAGIYAMYKNLCNIPVIPVAVDSGKCWPRRSFRKIPGTITLDFRGIIKPGLSKELFIENFNKSMYHFGST
ncbi:MAG: 1-acyl-sn-glycerol-3-phosphate acyltransferase [Holosporales bacterium]|nr:1-acyl-sn-glycerol-3-phosphate acyltransferase [Holosporales bacterium]